MSDEPSILEGRAASEEPAGPTVEAGDLERLNPKVQLHWFLRVLVGALFVSAVAGGVAWWIGGPVPLVVGAAAGLVLVIGIPHTWLRFRVWGFVLRDDSLYLQRGVFVRVETVVPYVRIQHVDTRRSPLQRITGLASSVVYTAGSRGADVSIPGLEPDRARTLQHRLKDLANVSGTDDAV